MEQRHTRHTFRLIFILLFSTIFANHSYADNCQGWQPTGSVFAGCVYGSQGTNIWGQQVTNSFASIEAAINYYQQNNLQQFFPGLDLNKGGLVMHGVIYMGGTLPIFANYITSQVADIVPSGTIHTHDLSGDVTKQLTISYMNVDGSMVSKTFSQQVANSSTPAPPIPNMPTQSIENQLQSFAKGNDGQQFLTGLLQSRVANSSIDPVAGNPSSFMARLVDNDFDLANESHAAGESEGGLTLFGVTPQYTDSSISNLDVKTYTLPLRYNHFFNNSNNIIIDMPITAQTVNDTTTYSMGLGAAYTHFLVPHWSLMPAFHVGVVGSLDLGSATMIYDGALASRVTVPLDQVVLGMTNDVSYLKTQSITIADYSIAYKLSNWLTKNGVDVNYLVGQSYSVGTYFDRVDVLSGSRWYVSDYNEVGVKTAKISVYNDSKYNFLTLGVGYLFGPSKFSGVNVSLGINF